MKKLLILLAFLSSIAHAEIIPKNFYVHKDTLIEEMTKMWPDITIPSSIAGLIEQETCYSLTHSKCWSTQAALKTEREYGFGLGQLTVTSRFNAFEEVKQLESRLKGWKWDDRFDSRNQIIAIIAMVKRNFRVFRSAEKDLDQYAFAFASYNGGIGGIQSDQRICKNTTNCNPNLWFDNVEHTSLKKKTAVKGYGLSFFEINRKYPVNVLNIRRMKYKPFIDPNFKNVKL